MAQAWSAAGVSGGIGLRRHFPAVAALVRGFDHRHLTVGRKRKDAVAIPGREAST